MLILFDFDRVLLDLESFYRAAGCFCVNSDVYTAPSVADFIYPDAEEFILRHYQTDYLCIVTSGAEDVQGPKIRQSGIEKYFREVIRVPSGKEMHIKDIVTRFSEDTVVFVDDIVAHLTEAVSMCPSVIPIRMRRNSKAYTYYADTPDGIPTVSNFADIEVLLKDMQSTGSL
jgi:FMN phosphatase YigB (HAD superfamily)